MYWRPIEIYINSTPLTSVKASTHGDLSLVNFYSERVVRWDNGNVVMIDQTGLPLKLSYLRCTNHHEIVDAIRRMAVRGAPVIGVAAAMGLALTAWHSETQEKVSLLSELDEAGRDLGSARPTAVNLKWAVQRVLNRAKQVSGDVGEVRKAVLEEALAMADEDVATNQRIGRHGSALLEDGDVVLTHCKWLFS